MQKAEINTLQTKINELEAKIQSLTNDNTEQKSQIELLEEQVERQLQIIADLECKRREDEAVRRKLHNDLQELKGNIRVFCRVRPIFEDENAAEVEYPGVEGKQIEISAAGVSCCLPSRL